MVTIKDFKALRPKTNLAKDVAALPYDVYSTKEAAEEIKKHTRSFLQVDLPAATVDTYDGPINDVAVKNFEAMKAAGIFEGDDTRKMYVYELDDGARKQRGLMCLASVDDYLNDRIKKHEKTRREKEEDRVDHIDRLNAQTGPIFLTYRNDDGIADLIAKGTANAPELDFTTDDGITHRVWTLSDRPIVDGLVEAFKKQEALYIADGHHRSASAVRVAKLRREQFGPGDADTEYNYFMAILYPADQLHVYDYNRVVADLKGLSEEAFLKRLEEKFVVTEKDEAVRPEKKGVFGMYLADRWYCLEFKGEVPEDVIEALDVSILQDNLLAPILGIDDPRSDGRIDFVGGVRGLKELERRVKDDMAVAFSMYPTALEELMAVADSGKVMPPKSTWFEPKPRSGLFIHELDELK
ncbi:DUF1015 domain-containing protein [Peptoniphilus sp. HCN-40583]|uniref:DUF1015 domain-containing protein n=1 Tax=Peptoniphilus sp. HCN-40583 TaxID=3134662 RepID=UPI0030C186B1